MSVSPAFVSQLKTLKLGRVLESLDVARARGAHIYVEILGYAGGADASGADAPVGDLPARLYILSNLHQPNQYADTGAGGLTVTVGVAEFTTTCTVFH